MRILITLGLVLAIAGASGLTIDTWSNAAAIGGGVVRLDDNTAYVVAIAVLGALAGLFYSLASKHHKVAGGVLATGWCLATLFSIGASIDRVGGAKDAAVHAGASVNARIERLDASIARWTGKIEQQRPVAARECRGYREGRSSPKRWPNCLTARSLIAQYEAKLAVVETERNKHGITKDADPGGSRIEALTHGAIKAEQWRTYHPIIGVGALTLLYNGMLLLAGALLTSSAGKAAPRVIDVQAREINPVLKALEHQRNPVTNRQLAELTGRSEATMHRDVKKLCAAGLVIKERAGRAQMIRLA